MEAGPLDDVLPFRTSFELFERSARLYPDRLALRAADPGGRCSGGLSYQAMFHAIVGVANQYADMGLLRGETVAVILPNLVETHLAIWAAEAVGRVCLINPFLEPDHIAAILQSTRSRILVTESAGPAGQIGERVAQALHKVPDLLGVLGVRTIFAREPDGERVVPGTMPPHGISLTPLVVDTQPGSPRFVPVREAQEIASYLHTGGTTGAPKVAARSHRNITSQGWVVSAAMGFDAEDVVLCGLPLFHTNGVVVTGVAPFCRGASVILATPDGYRDPRVIEGFWTLARDNAVTHFAGVPTIYSRLLETFDHPAPTLKFGICGAAPMSVDLFRAFEQKTGVRIIEGYGLTEAGCVSTLNPVQGPARIGSIGLRLPYQEIRIVTGTEVPLTDCRNGEPGEVIVRGPNVFEGYVDGRQNQGMLLEDGWLATGDLGRMDAEGYIWLTGRAKDLIIRGGHNIDPAVAEAALSSHPDVALAAVVGRPDADLGELPVAYVRLRPGGQVTESVLLSFTRQAVSERAAAPVAVRILEELPVTAVGKIYKPELRRMATQTAVDAALSDEGVLAEVRLDSRGRLSCFVAGGAAASARAMILIARLAPHMPVTP